MRAQGARLPARTDWDLLNDLIDWYEKNKPEAGQVIQVKMSKDYLAGKCGEPDESGLYAYRGRKLQVLTV